jgi:hypothetical protein
MLFVRVEPGALFMMEASVHSTGIVKHIDARRWFFLAIVAICHRMPA